MEKILTIEESDGTNRIGRGGHREKLLEKQNPARGLIQACPAGKK
jgi:hypothetical protein